MTEDEWIEQFLSQCQPLTARQREVLGAEFGRVAEAASQHRQSAA